MVMLEERSRTGVPERTDVETVHQTTASPTSSELERNTALVVEADREARRSLLPVVTRYLVNLLEIEAMPLG